MTQTKDTSKTYRFEQWPVLGYLTRIMRWIELPGFQGLSLFDLIEIYGVGLVKGAISSRASAIAYSFFMAIFPFLLFMLNVIPYLPIRNFQARFLRFIDDLLPAQTHDFFYPVIEDIATNPRTGLLSFTLIWPCLPCQMASVRFLVHLNIRYTSPSIADIFVNISSP